MGPARKWTKEHYRKGGWVREHTRANGSLVHRHRRSDTVVRAHYSRNPLLPEMERTRAPTQKSQPPGPAAPPNREGPERQRRGYKLRKSPNVINGAMALEKAGLLVKAGEKPICELTLAAIGIKPSGSPTEWFAESKINKRVRRKWEGAEQITLKVTSTDEHEATVEYRIDVEMLFHQDGSITRVAVGSAD